MSANSQTLPADSISGSAVAPVRAATLPWYCYAVVFGAACIPIGVLWDISWHITIGRDTFWTPAHMMIYLGGTLPGCICGWLVLENTFWPDPGEQAATVRLWGFHGPIGAWVTIWGAFVMLVAAPFDDWWHNAYGLDVQILSPPHVILALGTYAVAIGALIFVVSWQNRAPAEQRSAASLLFLFACGVLVTKLTIFVTEYTYPNHQHGGLFYEITCALFPLYLVVAVRASNLRWAATGASITYTLILLALVWVLPLFRAQPKLAPIYNPVDHMVPPPFPFLLILPALGIDLVMRFLGQRRGFWRDTGLALVLGLVFFVLLIAAQWPFSKFLLSPASRNVFFAGNAMWGYGAGLGDWCTQFWDLKQDPFTLKAALLAILFGSAQSRIALWFGNWLSAVKR
jgi:hypothetical protein